MENMSASNCQYVQILDLHQARPGSSQPTYLSQSGHPLLTGTLHLNHALGAAGQGQQLSLGLSPAELVRDGIIDCHPGDMTTTRGKGKGKARRTTGPAKQQQMQQQQQQQPSYYPRPSPAHFMQSVGLSPAHPAALRAGPSRVGPTGRKRVVDRLIRPESEYDVFVPKKSLSCKEFNARIDCKGCGAEFRESKINVLIRLCLTEPFLSCNSGDICVRNCHFREPGILLPLYERVSQIPGPSADP